MKIYSNAKDFKMSQAQARYFALQIYDYMKKYLAEHKKEYEEWLKQEKLKENESEE